MAIGSLLSALKVVPWSEVIAAAPAVVKGARKMFARTEEAAAAAPAPLVPDGTPPDARFAILEQRLLEMAEREQAAARVIESLAEQHAAVVQAVAILRARQRWLVAGLTVLAVLLAALALSYGSFGRG